MNICKVEGCGKEVKRRNGVCDMHYHRMWRGGTYERRRKRLEKYITLHGYIRIYAPDHPLSDSTQTVYEHRAVAYEKAGGEIKSCELCSRKVDWDSCHVDHIDGDKKNNDPQNLRITCSVCNTRRARKQEHEYSHNSAIEYGGKIDTAQGWTRDPRVTCTRSAIIRRLNKGLSVEEALFNKSITGPKRKPKAEGLA